MIPTDMIPKRIRHKGICDHAQTPYARRKCRAAKIAAAHTAKETTVRYTVELISGKYVVLDNGQPMGSLYSSHDAATAQRMADNLNKSTPASVQDTTARTPMRPGWSKAARARSGRTGRHHPLGRAVESGTGYTVYEDTALGGGRVQIWDHS